MAISERCFASKVCRLSVLLVVACTAVGGSAGAGGGTTEPLRGNVEPAVTAPGTKLAVVASGAPLDGVVPVIVRNDTERSVHAVRVRAVARDSAGRAMGRARTSDLLPRRLRPNALAVGSVDFDDPRLPLTATFDFTVRGDRGGGRGQAMLLPERLVLSPPLLGPVAQRLEVGLVNTSTGVVRGPIQVVVMCFGSARRPVFAERARVPTARVKPGAELAAVVEFTELCPSYLVAAAGRKG